MVAKGERGLGDPIDKSLWSCPLSFALGGRGGEKEKKKNRLPGEAAEEGGKVGKASSTYEAYRTKTKFIIGGGSKLTWARKKHGS